MFKCDNCNKTSIMEEKQRTVVTETRPKRYKNSYKVKTARGKKTITNDSEGWEIVKEIKVCSACELLLENKRADFSLTDFKEPVIL